MNLQLSQNQFLDLIQNKILHEDQAMIILNNFAHNKNDSLPYVTKSQLKIFRKMGIVKL